MNLIGSKFVRPVGQADASSFLPGTGDTPAAIAGPGRSQPRHPQRPALLRVRLLVFARLQRVKTRHGHVHNHQTSVHRAVHVVYVAFVAGHRLINEFAQAISQGGEALVKIQAVMLE